MDGWHKKAFPPPSSHPPSSVPPRPLPHYFGVENCKKRAGGQADARQWGVSMDRQNCSKQGVTEWHYSPK